MIQEDVINFTSKFIEMNIGKYIHQLLLENDTVIIPGFGAFISRYKPAELNNDTNELKPPSKTISFNQQIRNNDALLVGKVAEGEVISHFDALTAIEKERENIIYQLDKGNKSLLDEIGELFLNDQNEIQLIPIEEDNLLLDSFGLESVIAEEIAEPSQTIIIPEEKEEIEDVQKPEPVEKVTPVVAKEPTLDAPKETEEKKKKRGWLWILLILAPIIVVGVYITTKQTKQEEPPAKSTPKIIPEIIEKPVVIQDSTSIDSIPAIVQDSIPVVEIEETPEKNSIDSDKPKFYLVGGSFKIEENANTYFLQLKDQGFEPFHLGKRGNFFIVGIGTYNSEREALTARRVFHETNPNSDIWILEE
ncbi:MAG: SPOR domain-containing protein [Mycoplasmataceae bacterium]|nr:SPOR domain-containing protein [Mycoplasmataceae bacterium]